MTEQINRSLLKPNTEFDPHYLPDQGWLSDWEVTQQSACSVELRHFHDGSAVPYTYEAQQRITVLPDGAKLEISVTNRGDRAMPFSIGLHPFFPLTPQTTLQTKTGRMWTEEPGFLPGHPVALPNGIDFSTPRHLPDHWMNNGFEDWSGTARIHWPEREAVLNITADPVFRCMFLYRPGQSGDHSALEPMSHMAMGIISAIWAGLSFLNRVKYWRVPSICESTLHNRDRPAPRWTKARPCATNRIGPLDQAQHRKVNGQPATAPTRFRRVQRALEITLATEQADSKYKAPALEKGLDIVELLAGFADGLTLGEIARELSRSQSEIYRMLTTLVRRGYVVRSTEDDRYSLSLKMFAISQRHAPISRLLEFAPPKMRTVSRKAWQSCHMAMESNGDIVIVASAESPGNWALGLRIGTLIGLANTGSGRILAAFRSDDEVDDLIARHRLAVGEPALDRGAFMEQIARIRELGYHRMPSQTAISVTNMAYPIFDQNRRAVAAITCPFLERIDELKVPEIDEVHDMYKALSEELSAFYSGE